MSLPPLLHDTLRLPVIGAPMFIVSGPELVLAQCRAGIVGSFPALNARPPELLDTWLTRISEELAAIRKKHPDARVAPFGVNQIVHSSNVRLQHDVDLCVKHRVPILITSLRAPDAVVEAAHSYGGLVFHDVTTIAHAKGMPLAPDGRSALAGTPGEAAVWDLPDRRPGWKLAHPEVKGDKVPVSSVARPPSAEISTGRAGRLRVISASRRPETRMVPSSSATTGTLAWADTS